MALEKGKNAPDSGRSKAPKSRKAKHVGSHRRGHKYAVTGFVLLGLAIIGVAALVISSIGLTGKILDNSSQRAKWERYLQPVVMFDPVPFASIEDADPLTVLQSAIWYTIINEPEEKQTFSDNAARTLKASDVDVSGAKLFGSALKLEHQSFGDFDLSYIYNEETQTYEIPVTGIMATYTAKIASVEKNGDAFALIVGYVSTTNQWMTDLEGHTYEAKADKYMKYILKKEKNQYYIASIEDPLPEELPKDGVQVTSPPPQSEAK